VDKYPDKIVRISEVEQYINSVHNRPPKNKEVIDDKSETIDAPFM